MSTLAPHEKLDGTDQSRADLLNRLAALRAAPFFHSSHPHLAFVPLSDALHLGLVDPGVFYSGWDIMASRYARLGVGSLLPLHRVWIGVRSSTAPAFGGFHHPDQGYRHLQMAAVFTRYGDLTGTTPSSPRLAALDLLRAYAHDCLHWGSYRVYRLWETAGGAEIHRIRYGINSRGVDGRTYSARDPRTSRTTRNLGVVMEGATDQEARLITRAAAKREHISVHGDGVDRLSYLDQTGQLTPHHLGILTSGTRPAEFSGEPGVQQYLDAMGSYALGVGTRYAAFLAEFGGDQTDELHDLIVTCTLDGSVDRLSTWFTRRTGASFEQIFRAPGLAGAAAA